MNDILKQINLRLSSPFVFSFCIAWVFINWPIVVGLFWYTPANIKAFGHDTYKDLIRDHISLTYNLILPAVSAMAYMVVVPLFGYLNSVYLAFVKKIKNQSVHGILQNLPISYKRYNKLATEARATMTKLGKDIEEEEKKHAAANVKIADLEKQLSDAKSLIDRDRRNSDTNALNGKWEFSVTTPKLNATSNKQVWAIEITENAVFLTDTNERIALINGYFFSPYINKVALQFYQTQSEGLLTDFGDRYVIFDVKIEHDEIQILNEMNGKSEFKRMKQS